MLSGPEEMACKAGHLSHTRSRYNESNENVKIKIYQCIYVYFVAMLLNSEIRYTTCPGTHEHGSSQFPIFGSNPSTKPRQGVRHGKFSFVSSETAAVTDADGDSFVF